MYCLTGGHSAKPYLILFALICHDVDSSQIESIVCFWVIDCNGTMTESGVDCGMAAFYIVSAEQARSNRAVELRKVLFHKIDCR